ncbi:FecR family protein [Hirschia litorea]|uniref:FecR family protein n=1 Tax=Hirschia litorea TaxID=1199156 RepID=A0ABW2INE3_9PROT
MTKSIEDREMEACAWIAKIDGGSATSEDIQALRGWLQVHPENKRAFEMFSSDFIAVRDLLSTVGEAVLDLEAASNPSNSFAGWLKTAKRNWGLMATGGALAASLIWGSFMLPGGFMDSVIPKTESPVFYASNVGEQETIQLADGSTVMLNTDTELSVEYTPYERRVQLVKGEAVFNVAKDPNRPFRVHSNRTVVQAIGTVFSVKSVKGKVELLVEEGIVEMTANAVAKVSIDLNNSIELSEKRRVTSGSYAVFESETDKLTEIKDIALVERRMSWRKGMLTFDNEPLREIVEEYNRYSGRRIVVEDPALQEIAIGGTFPIGQTDAFLDALEQGFGIAVQHRDDQTIYLTSSN